MQAWRVFLYMTTTLEDLNTAVNKLTEEISTAELSSASEAEKFRVYFLGQKRGRIT